MSDNIKIKEFDIIKLVKFITNANKIVVHIKYIFVYVNTKKFINLM